MEKNKQYYIDFFRANGFNCFPIPAYSQNEPEPKRADHRYSASRTSPNQPISPDENYGVIPLKDSGNVIVDLDHKELYRGFAEAVIQEGYMVIESPNGWHIPIKGLTGEIKKMMFYNLSVEPTKQIVEIQGYDHYVIGCGCKIWNKKKNEWGSYINRGTEVIKNADGNDITKLVDGLCKALNVKPKEYSRNANYEQRQRFKQGKVPTKGSSNNYFFNAGVVCKIEGLTKYEAEIRIKNIYDKWVNSDTYSGRPWENIQTKIDDVYNNPDIKSGQSLKSGRPSNEDKEKDLVKLCENMILDRKIFSDQETDEIFENKDGYLENITNKLHKDTTYSYPKAKTNF